LPFFPIGDDVRHDATPVYESFWLGTTGSDPFRPFIAIKTQNRPLSRTFSSQKLPAKRAIMPLLANEIKISHDGMGGLVVQIKSYSVSRQNGGTRN
jgi:hypothetical protein